MIIMLSTPLSYGTWYDVAKKLEQEKNMRVKYLRDKNHRPYAIFTFANGYYGWALCDKSDQFDKKFGKALASERGQLVDFIEFENVPKSILNEFVEFVKRTHVFDGISDIKNDVKFSSNILKDYETMLRIELDSVINLQESSWLSKNS